ncbi:hypothetical protein G7Z17_g12718 [Cylindrodendrum hubeiense]|uniref:Uncharacterized protein n=1 Tax=Cylindrodendrum hubeiense TaxID=595255 RepID=A0A9P5H1E2_9HYPO|nr:hypothetical protein G7Z17_g12718 [Cylindrodendrum hubeiense]
MNWTEGALARHSRRKGWDKDAARQKQYFAKARARKHEEASKRSPRASSFIPDYIPRSPQARDQQHVSSPARQRKITPRKRLLISQRDACRDTVASVSGESVSSGLEHMVGLLHASEPPRNQGNSSIDLESKRRKLLEKNDWTGVGFQKPILVDFSRQAAENRMPVPSEFESRPTKRQRIAEWPPRGGSLRGSDGKRLDTGDQMKIRISSQDLRWSRTNNSVRSPTSHRGPLPTFQAWASQQSSSLSVPSRPSPSVSFLDQPPLHSEDRSAPASSTFESRGQTTSPANEPEHFSGRRIKGRLERTPERPKYIVTSSPPMIHQPQPTRGRRLSLFDIRSPGPEDIGSVVAQIGASSDESHRVTEDDSQWNNWLNTNDSIGSLGYSNAHEDSRRSRSITPGISHYWNGSEDQSLPSGGYGAANEREDMDEAMEPPPPTCSPTQTGPSDSVNSASIHSEQELPALSRLDESDQTVSRTRVGSFDHGGTEKHVKAGYDLVLPSGTELPKAPNVQDLMDLLMEDEEEQPEDDESSEKTPEDEEEIWKRFVFDEDCTEISRKARQEAQQQTTHDLCLAMAGPPSDVAEPPSVSRDGVLLSPGSITGWVLDSPETLSGGNELTSPDTGSTSMMGTANSNTAHMGSPKPQHSDFKFHQPSLFVGKLASLPTANTCPVQLQPPKRRRGRSRKRRGDGRPDFRTIPGYDDDPIEECCEG